MVSWRSAHTMTALGCRVTDKPFFVCPRCGTTKTCNGDTPMEPVIVVPELVRRCRQFENILQTERDVEIVAPHDKMSTQRLLEGWYAAGLNESINVSANRPTL